MTRRILQTQSASSETPRSTIRSTDSRTSVSTSTSVSTTRVPRAPLTWPLIPSSQCTPPHSRQVTDTLQVITPTTARRSSTRPSSSTATTTSRSESTPSTLWQVTLGSTTTPNRSTSSTRLTERRRPHPTTGLQLLRPARANTSSFHSSDAPTTPTADVTS